MPTLETQNSGRFFLGGGGARTFIVSTVKLFTSPRIISLMLPSSSILNTIMREISVKCGRAGDQTKLRI